MEENRKWKIENRKKVQRRGGEVCRERGELGIGSVTKTSGLVVTTTTAASAGRAAATARVVAASANRTAAGTSTVRGTSAASTKAAVASFATCVRHDDGMASAVRASLTYEVTAFVVEKDSGDALQRRSMRAGQDAGRQDLRGQLGLDFRLLDVRGALQGSFFDATHRGIRLARFDLQSPGRGRNNAR